MEDRHKAIPIYFFLLLCLIGCDGEKSRFFNKSTHEVHIQNKNSFKQKIFFQKELLSIGQTFFQNNPNEDTVRHSFTQNVVTNNSRTINLQQIEEQSYYDNFVQNSGNQQVDFFNILWVVDNSSSMDGVQKKLGAKFEALAEKIIATNIDFNMEIIATGDGITFTPPSDVVDEISACNEAEARLPSISGHTPRSGGTLTSTKAKENKTNFLSDFTRKIKVGICGSISERGLKMSRLFFANNPNWSARDKLLIVIFVSNEDDESDRPPGDGSYGTVESYVKPMKNSKDRPGLVKIFSIVDIDTMRYGYSNGDMGKRYMKASKLTGGKYTSIDAENYTPILSDFGSTIQALLSAFTLTRPQNLIDENSIVVTVDGTSAGIRGQKWNYERATNSIRFTEGNIPESNAKIRVDYKNKLQSSFEIDPPIPPALTSTIQVSVNGNSWPKNSSKYGWAYQRGELTFLATPPPSMANILLTYQITNNQLLSSFRLPSPVHRDKVGTIEVSVDGTPSTNWRYVNGLLIFTTPPPEGANIVLTHEEADDLLQSFPLKQELQDKIEANIPNSVLEVRVDNRVIPPQGNWEYSNGKLVFDANAIPSAGRNIVVAHIENKELNREFDMGLSNPSVTPVEISVNGIRVSTNDWRYEDGKIKFTKAPPSGAKIIVIYKTLAEIGQIFKLRHHPHPDEIKRMQVIVNGKPLAKSRWEYRADSNSIYFKIGFVPKRNSVIEIDFTL